MIKTFCDKCGKEAKCKDLEISYGDSSPFYIWGNPNHKVSLEICEKCYKEIEKIIKKWVKIKDERG